MCSKRKCCAFSRFNVTISKNFLLQSLRSMDIKHSIRKEHQRLLSCADILASWLLHSTWLFLTCYWHRFMLEIRILLMVVLYFSEGTGFHMSRNTRYLQLESWCLQTDADDVEICLQVKFNKAAQSLTDIAIQPDQKKVALGRLIKVTIFAFQHAKPSCYCVLVVHLFFPLNKNIIFDASFFIG